MNRRKLVVISSMLGIVIILMFTNACFVTQILGPKKTPTNTPSPTKTFTPTPSPTPTPLPNLPVGQVFTGKTWELSVIDTQSIDEINMLGGVIVSPSSGNRWMAVVISMKNITDEEHLAFFSEGLKQAVSTQQERIPISGFILPGTISGKSATGMVAGTFLGELSISDENENVISFFGQPDSFNFDYTVQPGNSVEIGLLYALQPGQDILGIDFDSSSPFMLVN